VPLLDDLFLRHQPLRPQDETDAQEEKHDGERTADRGREEPEVLRCARQVPLEGDRDERDDERHAAKRRDRERGGDGPFGALLRLCAGDRESVAAMDDVHAVGFGAGEHDLLGRHLPQLFGVELVHALCLRCLAVALGPRLRTW
jgi:hypothetical protein